MNIITDLLLTLRGVRLYYNSFPINSYKSKEDLHQYKFLQLKNY